MIFRYLNEQDEADFRAAARETIRAAQYDAGVAGASNGKIELDIELFHPVFLDEIGQALIEFAESRRSSILPPEHEEVAS